MFGTLVSDMQTDVEVGDGVITGTLKYLNTGSLVETFGAGNFMALKFDVPEGATSCLVGMNPSEGTGLVEIIDDPDQNGAFKVTNEETQSFKMVTAYGDITVTKTYDLTGLTLESDELVEG